VPSAHEARQRASARVGNLAGIRIPTRVTLKKVDEVQDEAEDAKEEFEDERDDQI